MPKSSLDIKAIFQSLPSALLILTPDYKIVAATDYFYKLTFSEPRDLIGKDLLKAFPQNQDTINAKGFRNLKASLDYVRQYSAPHTIPVQRYDIKLPPNQKGEFMERWWRITNSPILDANGDLLYIVHATEDVARILDVLIEAEEALQRKNVTK